MKKFLLVAVSSLVVLAACTQSKPLEPSPEVVKELKEYGSIKKIGDTVDPVHGAETGFAYGAMKGAGETRANGVAVLHTFADGWSSGKVNLNILQIPEGQHFVVWAGDGLGPWTMLGEMKSIVGDTRHSLAFETTDNAILLTTVIVTIETASAPSEPGLRVAEGSLKQAQ